MRKFQELVKKGKLAENLMADKEFIDGAKKIFKSENIEIDDEKLKQLMGEIEAEIKKSNMLDDKSLEEVSGGITKKSVARGVIKTVTSITGLHLGSKTGTSIAVAGGGLGGALTGGAIGGLKGARTGLITGALIGFEQGAPIGVIAGSAAGGIIGYKLGQWICEKAGLEEN